jgi:predicted DNA binding protein
MSWQYPPVLILFGIGTYTALAFAAYSALYIRRNGSHRLATLVLVMGILEIVWTTAAAIKIASTDLKFKQTMYIIEQIGASAVIVCFAMLVLVYTNRDHWLTRITTPVLASGLVIGLFLLPTNPDGIMIVNPRLEPLPGGLVTFEHDFPPLFSLHHGWIIVTVGLPLGVLGYDLGRQWFSESRGYHWKPLLLLFLAGLLPLIATTFKVFDIYPSGGTGFNIAPAVNAISLVFVAIAVYVYRLFDLPPVAKDRAIEAMNEGYLVVNEHGLVLDSNSAAATMLEFPSRSAAVGRSITDRLPSIEEIDEDHEFTVGDRQLEATRSQLEDSGPAATWLLLLHDVTDRKRREARIEAEAESKAAVLAQLAQVTTREDIEELVCELLVDVHGYECACIARSPDASDADPGQLTVATSYGDDRGWLETVQETHFAGTATAAAFDQETTVSSSKTDETEIRFETELAVPLLYEELSYGVLTVLRTDSATDYQHALLEDFAAAIASKAHTADQRTALLTDTVTRVDLDVRDESCYLVELVRADTLPANASIAIRNRIVDDDEQSIHVLEASDCSASLLEEQLTALDPVDSVDIIDEEQVVMLVCVAEPTIGRVLIQHNGVVQSMHVESGQVRVTVDFPRRTDVQSIVDDVTEHWPETRVRSNRTVTPEETEVKPMAELTDKQHTAIETAYVLGFFDRPQRATGQDVANALAVSRSTAMQHIRIGERKVFEQLFSS